jgi:thiol:disulfide interchange protein
MTITLTTLRTAGLVLGGLLLLTACGGTSETSAASSAVTQAPVGDDGGTSDEISDADAGSYVGYADFDADRAAYTDGTVVLFFHAGWCPTCKEAERNLTGDPAGIPAGLTIVEVDFDEATDLRREYGVTQQHTFVSIAPDGSKLEVFTGAVTAADIAERA